MVVAWEECVSLEKAGVPRWNIIYYIITFISIIFIIEKIPGKKDFKKDAGEKSFTTFYDVFCMCLGQSSVGNNLPLF